MRSREECVVIGGGLAGLVAARRMQQLGLNPLVLEKGADDVGRNNARISGGLVHLAWAAMDDEPAALRAKLVAETDGEIDPEIADALAENAGRSIAWLADEGVEMRAKDPHVGYMKHALYPHRPGTGRRLRREFGPDLMMTRLYANFRSEGGRVLLDTTASGLEPGPAGEWAVSYRTGAAGRTETVSARTVLVADGGFQGNPEMVSRYVGPNAGLCVLRAMETATGDGLRMLMSQGASCTGLGRVYGHMVSYDALTNDELWPYPAVDKLCLVGALVDRSGTLYEHRITTGVELVTALARSEDPRGYVVVFDDALWTTAGKDNPYNTAVPNPDLVDRGGHLVTADTVADLAALLGVPAARLTEAVARHNADPERRPIEAGPFHAAKVAPGLTFTMGGVRVDAAGAVLDLASSPIPGLYAAGSTTGGFHGGPHGGYVGGLAVALEFGLLAAESIALAAESVSTPASHS